MHKTYHFVCFFNVLANVHILPRHFLPVFVMEWCLRSADALGPCNWPVFFWGSQNLVDLGTFKKKISEIWPCLLYFKNIWKFYVFGGRKRPVGTWWVNMQTHPNIHINFVVMASRCFTYNKMPRSLINASWVTILCRLLPNCEVLSISECPNWIISFFKAAGKCRPTI
jgi:hypothetical protein